MGEIALSEEVKTRAIKGPYSDILAGELFADAYKSKVRYIAQQDTYYVYDGRRWTPDGTLCVNELAKNLVLDVMPSILDGIDDGHYRDTFSKWMYRLHANKAREEMLNSARSTPDISAPMSDFDMNSRFFNTKNGVLDLETLNFMPHDHRYFLTKMANVTYNPAAKCARWEQFIDEVTNHNKDVAGFLQKAIGYAMMGNPTEQCLFILYGSTTRNGKGTLMHALGDVFGEYAATIRPETLATDRNRTGNSASSDLARLNGVRLVDASEPGKGMLFDAALVKNLTGGDKILARFMYKEPFEFIPKFTIFISTNHLPRVDDVTLFTSGRVYCIEFPVHFGGDKRDVNLSQLFQTEEARSAIFNWCVNGYGLYKAEGLRGNIPQAVLDVTREYEESSDTLGLFLHECVEQVPGEWTQSSVLYGAYKDWMEESGQTALGQKSFSMALKDRGYKMNRNKHGTGFSGLKLKVVSLAAYKTSRELV